MGDPRDSISVGGLHFARQTHFMTTPRGNKFNLDYIGRVENLADELRFLTGMKNLSVDVLHGPSKRDKPWLDNYARLKPDDLPSAITQQICQHYFDDFCCYGYA